MGGAWQPTESAWKCCRIVKSFVFIDFVVVAVQREGGHPQPFQFQFDGVSQGTFLKHTFRRRASSPFPPLAAFGFAFEVCTTQKPQNLINVAAPAPHRPSVFFFPQQKRVAVEARLACSASQILGSDSSSATASALGVLSFSGGRSRLPVSFPVKSV